MSHTPRPNILLITTDQQRGDALGINGNPWLETPNLDTLAATGLNFPRAYVTCPVCIPARRTLISGQSPNTHGLRWYEDDLEWDPPTTLPAELSRGGYQTQLVGKLHLAPMGKRYGFDNIVLSETSNWRPHGQPRNDYARWLREQGIDAHPHFHGINGNGRIARPFPLAEQYHQNTWLARQADRFLTEDRDPSCPFFLHLSFFHPHPPLVPVGHYFQRYLDKDLPTPVLGEWTDGVPTREAVAPDSATGPFDPEIIRRATAAYYALITHIDDCIAHVIERFREYNTSRQREPLYILFSSDHGEMLGTHHLFRKSLGYEASANVPFFISGFNVPLQQGSTGNIVCWEDIAPTLLDLAGLPVPDSMDGHSLAPLVRGEPAPPAREVLFGECGGTHHNEWITTERHKYIYFLRTGEEQVFDLVDDPGERHDLSGETSLLERLRGRFDTARAERGREPVEPGSRHPCGNQPPKVFWP